MMQSSADITQTSAASVAIAVNKKGEKVSATPSNTPDISSSQNCDILLSNFQIKRRRYRVLLNYNHIVWERLPTKRSAGTDTECTLKKGGNEAAYDINTNVMHINELIRVSKGNTKAAALHIADRPITEFGGDTMLNQQQEEQNPSTPPTEQYLALFYAARIINSATDCNRWKVRKLVLYNADAYVVRQWYDFLNKILANTTSRRLRVRRLLVFINPYGGRKKGLHVYERHCKPLFQLAGIDASCIISQRSNQIRDILLSHDLTPFDAICCVGGDGTVAEVINGLIFRAICDEGMDPRQPPYVPKPALPIAIIPAGSTDTVAYSLHGTSDVCTAVIHLLLGQRRGMDICSIRNREGLVRFCASLLSYGYLGDVAAKSERFRWMGTKRYEFTGFKTFLANNGYEAELRVLTQTYDMKEGAKETSTSSQISKDPVDTICCADCMRCTAAAVAERKLAENRALMKKSILTNTVIKELDDDDLPSSSNNSLKIWRDDSGTKTPYNKKHLAHDAVHLPKNINYTLDIDDMKNINLIGCDKRSETTDAEVKGKERKSEVEAGNAIDKLEYETKKTESCHQWKKINGKFFMISGANITCACTRSPNGMARYNHIGDGHLDLILVRKTSLLNNVRLLLNMMGRNGDIRNLPFVETYRTKRFRFCSPNVNLAEDFSIAGSCQPIASSAGDFDYDDEGNLSRWNCDGEIISDQELTMIAHCQLIDVFMRGPHIYRKPLENDRKPLLYCCCRCCKSDN